MLLLINHSNSNATSDTNPDDHCYRQALYHCYSHKGKLQLHSYSYSVRVSYKVTVTHRQLINDSHTVRVAKLQLHGDTYSVTVTCYKVTVTQRQLQGESHTVAVTN